MPPRPDEDDPVIPGTEAQLVRAVGTIGLATLASRILGFIRDVVVARTFGAGLTTDAFFVAFRIPNLLRRLLAEGALATAFVPVFSDYLTHRPREEFRRMLRAVAGITTVTLAGVTLLGILLAPWIVRAMAPGFWATPAKGEIAVTLTRLMFPYLFLVGLSALAMGALNSLDHFATPAFSPVMLNLGMIAGALILAPALSMPILGLGWGVLAGGVGQGLLQLPALRKRGVAVTPIFEPRHPAISQIGRLMAPAVFGTAVTQFSVLVDTVIASLLREGSVSFLYYADRIVEFPLGIFGIAIATAVLPALSRQASRGESRELTRTLTFALGLSAFMTLPASVGLIILREPIVRVLFQRGEFDPASSGATAWALLFYSLGLTSFAFVKIVAPAFYALQMPRTPVRVGMGAVALNVALALALMGPLRHGGLALATSCSATFNWLCLLILLGRKVGPIDFRDLWASLSRSLVGCVVVGALLWIGFLWHPVESRMAEALWLFILIATGAGAYWGVSALMRSPEVTLLSSLLRQRISRAA